MKTKRSEIGDRILSIRKKLEKTQTEFGDLLGGIKKSPISSYEKGDAYPRPDTLALIASLGKVTLDWLITGQEQENKTLNGTIEPDNQETGENLKSYPKVTEFNVHLRQIIEWMDAEFGQKDEQALFFYEDLKDRYPTFAEFMEKKRPGGSGLDTQAQNEKLNSA